MNLIYSAILIISTIISSTIGFPISIENGPAIVVKQNKPIIYSPVNETIIKAIIPPPPPPAPPGPIDEINDIMPAKFITMDGIVIYTPKDASSFILSVEQ
jgi:hypothetical protein